MEQPPRNPLTTEQDSTGRKFQTSIWNQRKIITFNKGDSYGNNIENDNYTDCDEDQNKDNDKDDNKDHWNDNDDDDKMMTMIIHSF